MECITGDLSTRRLPKPHLRPLFYIFSQPTSKKKIKAVQNQLGWLGRRFPSVSLPSRGADEPLAGSDLPRLATRPALCFGSGPAWPTLAASPPLLGLSWPPLGHTPAAQGRWGRCDGRHPRCHRDLSQQPLTPSLPRPASAAHAVLFAGCQVQWRFARHTVTKAPQPAWLKHYVSHSAGG